jgi:site-specific DNA recombinase
MTPYFGYVRVSDPGQKSGVSPQVQRADIAAFAKSRDIEIVEWFEEVKTAAKAGRKLFSRMLEQLDNGEAVGVVFHKIDRSARNLEDWNVVGKLYDRGIDVQFAHEPIDLSTRGGRLSADILAVVATDFIRNNRQEAKKGFYGRLKQGLYPLRAPVGYRDEGKGNLKSVDKDRAALVRQAFDLYATNAFGLRELRKEMLKRGLRSRNGQVLSLNSFSLMLRNPFYMGLIYIRTTGETFKGNHQPIISKATFERVQATLDGKTVMRSVKHDFLFRRLITCANCGLHLIGERQKSRYIYYRCHSGRCKGVSIREDIIEDTLLMAFKMLLCGEAELRGFVDLVEVERRHTDEEVAKVRASLDLRLAKCEERLSRLTDAYIDRMIDKDAFEPRKRGVLNEQQGLLDQIKSLSHRDLPRVKAFEKLELGNAAYSGYISGNLPERRQIINLTTSNLLVEGKKPVISLLSPYREIADWRKSTKCAHRRGAPRQRARELLDIIIAADQKEISTTVN